MNWKQNCTSPEWTASIAALISGLIVHLFGLVNVLHNYDDIAQQPRGYGTGVTSGRWLLSLLGDFSEAIGGNYNLPFFNGLLFLICIAISAGFLISVLQIRRRSMAACIGVLLITFPSAFSTLVFRYTSVYYGVAIFLSILAVWILDKYRYGLFISALCVACSLGIYQAYVPITIGLFVLLLLHQSLNKTSSLWSLIRRGLLDCAALLLGLLLYFLFLNITLRLYGTELSDYQGVNQMGNLTIDTLPGLLWQALYSFCMLPIRDYCGLAGMGLLKCIYLLLGGLSFGMLGYLYLKHIKHPLVCLFSMLMCFLFPIAVNFIVIMCPDSWIYTLIVYSFVLLPCVPVLLCERLSEVTNSSRGSRFLSKCLSILLSVMLCCYAYQTNVNYTALYYSNRQVENYLNSMVVQARMTAGYSPDMKWAFIGDIEDPLLHSYWQYEMNFGGIESTEWMLQRYSWQEWIRNYFGYSLPLVEEAELQILSGIDEVTVMPCWPSEGSIQVIGDVLVIKFQNTP